MKNLLALLRKQCTPTQVFAVLAILQTVIIAIRLLGEKSRKKMMNPRILRYLAVRYISLIVLILITRKACSKGYTDVGWGVLIAYIAGWSLYDVLIDTISIIIPEADILSTKNVPALELSAANSGLPATDSKILEGDIKESLKGKTYAPPTVAMNYSAENLLINENEQVGLDPKMAEQAPFLGGV